MQATAVVSKGWVIRFVIMFVMFFGFGCWAVYDGSVTYPKWNEAFAAYKALQDESPEKLAEWPKIAEEKGWSQDKPKFKSDWDIRTQFIMAGICLPLGIFFLIHAVRGSRQTFSADESGITNMKGQTIPYSDIKAIDWELWNKKGFAYVSYAAPGSGGDASMKVDDVKFIRANDVLGIIAQEIDQIDEKAIRMPWSKKPEETQSSATNADAGDGSISEDTASDEVVEETPSEASEKV